MKKIKIFMTDIYIYILNIKSEYTCNKSVKKFNNQI